MKELKVGERITIECVKETGHKCTNCVFYENEYADCPTSVFRCGSDTEFKKVEVHTFTDEELDTWMKMHNKAGWNDAIAQIRKWVEENSYTTESMGGIEYQIVDEESILEYLTLMEGIE